MHLATYKIYTYLDKVYVGVHYRCVREGYSFMFYCGILDLFRLFVHKFHKNGQKRMWLRKILTSSLVW